MFAKYDRDGDGALTLRELFDMMHGNRCAADPFGVCSLFSPPIAQKIDVTDMESSGELRCSNGVLRGC